MTELANALLGCVVFAGACAVILLIMAALLSRDTDTHPDGRRDKLEAEFGDEE